MGDANNRVVVFVHRSDSLEVGFAGEDTPRATIPSLVGQRKEAKGSEDEYVVGGEALRSIRELRITYPIVNGMVADLKSLSRLWRHAYNILDVDPREHTVMIAMPSPILRHDCAELLLLLVVRFDVPSVFLCDKVYVPLYTLNPLSHNDSFRLDSGKIKCERGSESFTGVIVLCDDDRTYIQSVFHNDSFYGYSEMLPFGARHLKDYMFKLLAGKGYDLASAQRDIVTGIVEKDCFASLDYESELATYRTNNATVATYELPNGKTINLGSERFQCPEILFKPSMIGENDDMSIQDVVAGSLNRMAGKFESQYNYARNHARNRNFINLINPRDLDFNIMLAGDFTLIDGLAERLKLEVAQRTTWNFDVVYAVPPGQKHSIWTGASSLATHPDCISQALSIM